MAEAGNGAFDVIVRVTPAGAESAQAAAAAGPTCKLQYGSEDVSVSPSGRTVRALFEANAEQLGYVAGRAVQFRSAGSVVNGDSPAVAGRTYVAQVSYEQKGR